MTLRKFTTGAYTFAEIIDRNYIYADKTQFIYNLLKSSDKDFFLSRPRRFGKTLLLSTLHELFTGNRGRFQELWIGGSDYDFLPHPVIHFSMTMESKNAEILEKSILHTLQLIAKDANLYIDEDSLILYLKAIILELYKKTNSKVVILIDEYDAPVTRNMENFKVAEANAKVLHNFFATLKDEMVYPYIHFTP
jgi:hypothetical protein